MVSEIRYTSYLLIKQWIEKKSSINPSCWCVSMKLLTVILKIDFRFSILSWGNTDQNRYMKVSIAIDYSLGDVSGRILAHIFVIFRDRSWLPISFLYVSTPSIDWRDKKMGPLFSIFFTYGYYSTIGTEFFEYDRMMKEQFAQILHLDRDEISKKHHTRKPVVQARERWSLTIK